MRASQPCTFDKFAGQIVTGRIFIKEVKVYQQLQGDSAVIPVLQWLSGFPNTAQGRGVCGNKVFLFLFFFLVELYLRNSFRRVNMNRAGFILEIKATANYGPQKRGALVIRWIRSEIKAGKEINPESFFRSFRDNFPHFIKVDNFSQPASLFSSFEQDHGDIIS